MVGYLITKIQSFAIFMIILYIFINEFRKLSSPWRSYLYTNTFCHNILSTSTAIYSQSAENTDKSFINFYQRVQKSRQYRRNYQYRTNSLLVIRHQVLGLNVLGPNSCAICKLLACS